MKHLCLVLGVSVLTYTLAPDVLANDTPKPAKAPAAMSPDEDREFAAREAESPQLENFEAGDALGFVIAVLIIVALVVLIYYLLQHSHNMYRSHRMEPGTR